MSAMPGAFIFGEEVSRKAAKPQRKISLRLCAFA
jgi:hypothetical protein